MKEWCPVQVTVAASRNGHRSNARLFPLPVPNFSVSGLAWVVSGVRHRSVRYVQVTNGKRSENVSVEEVKVADRQETD